MNQEVETRCLKRELDGGFSRDDELFSSGVTSKKKRNDERISKAHDLFQKRIHSYIQQCMCDAGFNDFETSERNSEYLSFMSDALDSENEWYLHELFALCDAPSQNKGNKLVNSLKSKLERALQTCNSGYASLLFSCMGESGFASGEIDANSETYSQLKTLTLESEYNRLNYLLTNKNITHDSCLEVQEAPSIGQKIVKTESNFIHISENFTNYLYIENDKKFVLKVTNDCTPSLESHKNYTNTEHEISKCLIHPGVRKSLQHVEVQNKKGLLLKWVEGITIEEYGKFQVQEFLIIAREIVSTVVALHASLIIHTNLTTDHIIVDKKTQCISIIGFRFASKPDSDSFITNHHLNSQRNPKFISPEQSGWICRKVDFMSDFFSLGMIFYFMLTGQLPYESDTYLSMFKLHLGQVPKPLKSLDNSIPCSVSDMVLKLLEKRAENRYQTAKGILYDIDLMISEYEINQLSSEIQLATHDISDKFNLPQTLYGRKSEFAILLSAFDRAATGSFEIFSINGSSGSGKSFLVESLSEAIFLRNGFFITGKYNGSLKNEPYSALIKAIENFCAIVLMVNKKTLFYFKTRILQAVEGQGKILTDAIHNLHLVIGEQPDVAPAVSDVEAKHRFQYVFFTFIRAICASTHPILLFLDDLHWADSSSIELLTMMSNDKSIQYLFLVRTYCVDGDIDEVINEDSTENIHVIKLNNLDHDNVNDITSATLNRSKVDTFPFSAFIYEKTSGNAFLVMQILLKLKEENILKFCYNESVWKWDASHLEGFSASDYVMPLLVKKLLKIKSATLNLLKVLSCTGSQFPSSMLNIISGDYNVIQHTITEGFLVQTSTDMNYRFANNHVHKAILSLIPENELKSNRLFIGKQLWDQSPVNERHEYLFIVTNLLNSSLELIKDPLELRNLAQLNYLSGEKAKEKFAFRLSLNYLQTAIQLLETDRWTKQYEFCLNVFDSTAEVTYHLGQYSLMDRIVRNIKKHARTTLCKVNSYSLQIRALGEQRLTDKAVEYGLYALECLGEKMILKPVSQIIPEIEEIKHILNETDFNIKPSKRLEDKYKLAILRILSELIVVVYLGSPHFLPAIVCRMMQIMFKHGFSIYSGSTLAIFGSILCIYVDGEKVDCRYKEVALQLLDKSTRKHPVPITYLAIYSTMNFWFEHISFSLDPLKEAYNIGMESGANQFAFLAIIGYFINAFLIGNPLPEIQEEMNGISNTIPVKCLAFASLYEIVKNLSLTNPTRDLFRCDAYVKATQKQRLQYNFVTILDAYYFHKYERASSLIEESKALYEKCFVGNCTYQFFVFYSGLVAVSMAKNMAKKDNRQKYWLQIAGENISLLKLWSEVVPENFQNKFTLLEAEMAYVVGNKQIANKLFKDAIYLSNKHYFVNEEALANERAGIFSDEIHAEESACRYFKKALKLYANWGAVAKLQHIESLYSKYVNKDSDTASFSDVGFLENIEVNYDVVSEISKLQGNDSI